MSDNKYIFVCFIKTSDENQHFHIENVSNIESAQKWRTNDINDESICVLSDVSEINNLEINKGGLSKIRRFTESIWKLGLVERMYE